MAKPPRRSMAGAPCKTCSHPKRKAIDARLSAVPRQPISRIAREFGLPETTLARHKKVHLPAPLQVVIDRHAKLEEETREMDVLASLGRMVNRAESMLAASDEWLRDPANPEKYNLDPRSSEVWIVWQPHGGGPRQKARLSELLERIETISLEYVRKTDVLAHLAPYDEARESLAYLTHAGPPLPVRSEIDMRLTEAKVSDPRELLLKAIATLKPVLELLGKATGQLKAEAPAVQMQINVLTVRKQVELVAKELGVSADELMGKTEEFAVMLEKEGGK